MQSLRFRVHRTVCVGMWRNVSAGAVRSISEDECGLHCHTSTSIVPQLSHAVQTYRLLMIKRGSCSILFLLTTCALAVDQVALKEARIVYTRTRSA